MGLKVTGIREIVQNLAALGPQVSRRIGRGAMSKAMKPVLASAKGNAARIAKSGSLVAALKTRVQSADQIRRGFLGIGNTKDAVRGSVVPVGKDRKALALYSLHYRKKRLVRRIRHGHLVEFGTKRSAAKPFMRAAIEQNGQRVVDTLANEMRAGIDRELRRRRK
jgi:HK97 gp10 family phage protein